MIEENLLETDVSIKKYLAKPLMTKKREFAMIYQERTGAKLFVCLDDRGLLVYISLPELYKHIERKPSEAIASAGLTKAIYKTEFGDDVIYYARDGMNIIDALVSRNILRIADFRFEQFKNWGVIN